jgi:putative intracellular protease/amidase
MIVLTSGSVGAGMDNYFIARARETNQDRSMARIFVPLPDRDFDTTEVAVPWKILTRAGHEVVFATEEGACDPLLLTGVLFGALGAAPEPKAFYAEMIETPPFQKPLRWRDVEPSQFDALLLPGGHAPGMRQYLGSELLQEKVAAFWALDRPVAAICHGVLVLARAKALDGKSVLHDRRTTCLPKYMERTAYYLTAWRRGRYYRTYDAYVEDEVRAALDDPATQFQRGPRVLTARGTDSDDGPTFLVEDRNYLSARWPGDSYRLAKALLAKLR